MECGREFILNLLKLVGICWERSRLLVRPLRCCLQFFDSALGVELGV